MFLGRHKVCLSVIIIPLCALVAFTIFHLHIVFCLITLYIGHIPFFLVNGVCLSCMLNSCGLHMEMCFMSFATHSLYCIILFIVVFCSFCWTCLVYNQKNLQIILHHASFFKQFCLDIFYHHKSYPFIVYNQWVWYIYRAVQNWQYWEFPGSSMVRTLYFHWGGTGLIPDGG